MYTSRTTRMKVGYTFGRIENETRTKVPTPEAIFEPNKNPLEFRMVRLNPPKHQRSHELCSKWITTITPSYPDHPAFNLFAPLETLRKQAVVLHEFIRVCECKDV